MFSDTVYQPLWAKCGKVESTLHEKIMGLQNTGAQRRGGRNRVEPVSGAQAAPLLSSSG